MKRYVTPVLLGTLLALVAAPCALARDRATEEELVERTASIAADGRLRVENTNGSIYVESWDGSEVQISATKKAQTRWGGDADEMLDEIEIKITERGGDVEIETELPRGGWGRGGSGSVDYEIKVPASVSLHLKSTNGRIEVDEIEGDVEIQTTNGSISANDLGGRLHAKSTNGRIEARGVAGPIEARTTNGSIDAEITATVLDDDVDITTTNGSVELRLPADVAARVDARTSNGRVSSDLPLTVSGARKNSLVGELGSGGPTIRIRTSNGSIRLRDM